MPRHVQRKLSGAPTMLSRRLLKLSDVQTRLRTNDVPLAMRARAASGENAMYTPATQPSPPSLWQNRSFLRLWLAQVISNAGTSITNVALPLTAVLVLGATPAQMGLLGIAGSLPNLLFGFVAGVWVDRTRRRPILVGADLGRAILLGSIPLAAWLGHVSFLHLWIVAFLAGSLTVFFQIASIAVLPALVSKAQLVEANSKLSISDSVISIAGPGMAGGLVQLLSAPKAIVVDAVSYLLSALALGGIGAAEARPARGRSHFWGEIAEGIRELVNTPLLKILTITSSIGMLAGAVQNTVMVLFLARELSFSPATIGLVFACGGGGSLLGALCAGWAARRLQTGLSLILGKSLWIIGSLLVALAGLVGPGVAFVAGGEVLIGLGITIYFVNQLSLRQALTETHLLGRVTAARRFILFGMALLGAALGGALGTAIGLRATLLVGAITLVAELALIVRSPVRQASV
jgi:MFS family permease